MSTSPSEEGDGLRRADSLPALRVVGFDLLRGSESAHEMHLLSQSGIASPAVSSPLSRLLGATTGKRERESPDGGGFFSAESSDSDAREAVAPLEKATSMLMATMKEKLIVMTMPMVTLTIDFDSTGDSLTEA